MTRRLAPLLLLLLAARPDAGAAPGPVTVVTTFTEMVPGLRAVAADFQRETGTPATVEGIPYAGYELWVRTQFLSGSPPAVLLLDSPDLAAQYGQAGLTRAFDDALARENPFRAEGPWKDAFRPEPLQQARDAMGRAWCLPFSRFGIGFFYDRDTYARLGLVPPRTWSEFTASSRRIRAAGGYAMAVAIRSNDFQTVWMGDRILECLLRVHAPEVNTTHAPGWKFDPRDPACTAGETIDLDERTGAFLRGTIDPARAPEFAETVRLIRSLAGTWRPEMLSLDGDEVYKYFVQGKAAQLMNGTWFLTHLSALLDAVNQGRPGHPFSWGTFPFPELTPADSPLVRAGGVNQQAGVRGVLLLSRNRAHPERDDAGLRFCQFLSTPREAAKVFGSGTCYDLPALRGVPARPEALPLDSGESYAFLPLGSFTGWDAENIAQFWTAWQLLFAGRIDEQAFLRRLSDGQRQALVRLARLPGSGVPPERIDALANGGSR